LCEGMRGKRNMKEVIKTICDMCYYYCGLDVTVEDGRITRVAGSPGLWPVSFTSNCCKFKRCVDEAIGAILRNPYRIPEHNTHIVSPVRIMNVDIGSKDHVFFDLKRPDSTFTRE
jgi:hypothetical protein